MTRFTLLAAASLLLAGCAGGPIAIKSGANAREVNVDGAVVVVSGQGAAYGATFRDYLANNLFVSNSDKLVRKVTFTRAIEQATGCKVTESVIDDGAATLNAIVKC